MDFAPIQIFVFLCCMSSHVALVIKNCPVTLCNCSDKASCVITKTSDFKQIGLSNLKDMQLSVSEDTIRRLDKNITNLLPRLKKLKLLDPLKTEMLIKLLKAIPSLKAISVSGRCHDEELLKMIAVSSDASHLEIVEPGRTCSYKRFMVDNGTCSKECFPFQPAKAFNRTSRVLVCFCRSGNTFAQNATNYIQTNFNTSDAFLNTTLGINATNTTNQTYSIGSKIPKKTRYPTSIKFSIILGSISLVTLVLNFIILAKMCRCQGQSVSKIFGMGMMLFNMLLAEYGIGLAIYLTQENGIWNRSFCQSMTALKMFSMAAVIFNLMCLTFQWSINPPDDNYNTQDVRFKAIVYILEGIVLAGMVCVLSWTKFDDWEYLCQLNDHGKTADKIIIGIEYCYYCLLFLLALRFPYKSIRRKEPAQSYIKMKYVVEREHPVFVMVVVTFLVWSVPYFVTIPALGITSLYLTPVVRNCALMLGAAILPLLFVIRNTRICCSKHTACGVNDPRVCQCKGRSSDMCYACEVQHKDMISNCEFHSFGDRRKSLSLDDLKYVLGIYKKQSVCNLKIKKKKLVSRSFPILNMDTIEEADYEDINDIDRIFLGNGKNLELSIETQKNQRAALTRENTTSLPLLTSPRKLPAPGKTKLHMKLSLSPRKTALPSPVRKALQKQRAATFDDHLIDQNAQSSSSDRSTTSSPTKSDNEKNSLLKKDKKPLKRTKKSISKSKESVKSRDSTKSRENCKKTSKNQLEVEVPNTDSSGPASPNRVSRIPSFIPLADAESSCSSEHKKSPHKALPGKSSPAKVKMKKKSLSKCSKSKEDEEAELLGNEPGRVASRGPTFYLVDDEDANNESCERPLLGKEKKSKGLSKKRREARKGGSKEGTPIHHTDGGTGSRNSLEWDPSFSLSDSSCSSPIDEFNPPEPAPPPSNFALERVREMGVRNPDSPHVSIGRGSSYSMDWDPTGIQERHSVTSQCDWEPYSVDEARSDPTSPENIHVHCIKHSPPEKVNINNNDASEIISSGNNAPDTHQGVHHSETAPLAKADV